ncbi:MAG: efflux transporter outer membrane subunit [Phycisphaeraceae bacterium]|nr:efflux transporter outer membrane subunit [Phycisphaeraceae bacterium]
MTRSLRHLLMLMSSAILASCSAVGPDYIRPDAEVSLAFRNPAFHASGTHASDRWWETFQDPVLTGLIEDAVHRNQDLRIAVAAVREARAARGIADSRGMPSIDANASYRRLRASENGVLLGPLSQAGLASVETDLYQTGLEASWEIDVFGSVRRENEAATARVQEAHERLADALVAVAAEVGLAYTDLRGTERELAVLRRNIEVQSQTATLVQSQFKTGIASEIDSDQARSQLARTRAQEPLLQAAIDIATYRLAVLTGRMPGELTDALKGSAALVVRGDLVPVGLPSELLLRRPDVRAAERGLHAATADVGVAVAELYPRFFLTGATGFESVSFGDLFNSQSGFFAIGPTIQWPVFRGGALRAQVVAAEARADAQYARYQQSILLAVEDVERSLVEYGQQELRRRQLVESRDAAVSAATLTRRNYDRGIVRFLDVLDAERRALDSDIDLVRSEVEVTRQAIRLYRALGGGWQHSLGALDSEIAVK